MQIPQTHFKQVPEMNPYRYIHTRDVYRYSVLLRLFGVFEVPSCQEQSVDIRFLKNIIDFPRAVAINSSEQRSHSVEV